MKLDTHNWIWRWHVIGGLISLPIVLILSITGAIYLFKDQYEKNDLDQLKHVEVGAQKLSYQDQWTLAVDNWNRAPSAIVIPSSDEEATQFISGRFSHKSSIYINPFNGKVNGQQQVNETEMYQVRKLHGELLLGSVGTKIVELVACWLVVLIFTGIYIFWPKNGWKDLFRIRYKSTRRILFRDLHAVTGFWFSVVLLLILAGGLPWTDVFGTMFKNVQTATDSGFPATWHGHMFSSEVIGDRMSLDKMIEKAISLELSGEVHVSLPSSETAIYTVSNETSELHEMRTYHFDAYSGNLLHMGTWKDIGSMMKARLWAMAFHQGEFGMWNWMLVLLSALALFFLSLFALLSYLRRKQKGQWGIPPSPKNFRVGKGILVLLILLALILPMFGVSLLLISGFYFLRKKLNLSKNQS